MQVLCNIFLSQVISALAVTKAEATKLNSNLAASAPPALTASAITVAETTATAPTSITGTPGATKTVKPDDGGLDIGVIVGIAIGGIAAVALSAIAFVMVKNSMQTVPRGVEGVVQSSKNPVSADITGSNPSFSHTGGPETGPEEL